MTRIPPTPEPVRCSSPLGDSSGRPVFDGEGGKREIRRSAQKYLVTSTDAMIGISDLLQRTLEEGLTHNIYGVGAGP